MGTVITKFTYSTIEEALTYSSYYSDLLITYKNTFESTISMDGTHYNLEFKIHGADSRGKDNTGDSKGIRYLPESSSENNPDSI